MSNSAEGAVEVLDQGQGVPKSASPSGQIKPADLFSLIIDQNKQQQFINALQSTILENTSKRARGVYNTRGSKRIYTRGVYTSKRMSVGDGGTTLLRETETIAKLKFNADQKITMSLMVLEIETYFRKKGTLPLVPAVLEFFDKSGNVYAWIASKILQHCGASDDPDSMHQHHPWP